VHFLRLGASARVCESRANRCCLESGVTGAGVSSEHLIGAPIGVVGGAPIWMPVGRDGVGTRLGSSIQRVGGGSVGVVESRNVKSPLCNIAVVGSN